jgi:hypothetical protein
MTSLPDHLAGPVERLITQSVIEHPEVAHSLGLERYSQCNRAGSELLSNIDARTPPLRRIGRRS